MEASQVRRNHAAPVCDNFRRAQCENDCRERWASIYYLHSALGPLTDRPVAHTFRLDLFFIWDMGSNEMVGSTDTPPLVPLQHHSRPVAPSTPLLPRRYRRYPSYTFTKTSYGLKGGCFYAADAGLRIRLAQLCYAATLPEVYSSEQL